MLSAWEAIKVRRSIRKFAPDDVPKEMIDQMLEAARLAPSGGNVQPIPGRKGLGDQEETRGKMDEAAVYRGSTGSNYLLR